MQLRRLFPLRLRNPSVFHGPTSHPTVVVVPLVPGQGRVRERPRARGHGQIRARVRARQLMHRGMVAALGEPSELD